MDTPDDPRETTNRFVVNHDHERHQWQVIDRHGSKEQYVAVIAELDDCYLTSERVVTRYCRQLNEELRGESASPTQH